jgi:hypothetical protein
VPPAPGEGSERGSEDGVAEVGQPDVQRVKPNPIVLCLSAVSMGLY